MANKHVMVSDIGWLAGIIEGEGSISYRNGNNNYGCPRIQFGTTDKDIAERFARLLNYHSSGPYKTTNGNKGFYKVTIQGSRAIGLLMTILPFLGIRRAAKAKEVINSWKKNPNKPRLPYNLEDKN